MQRVDRKLSAKREGTFFIRETLIFEIHIGRVDIYSKRSIFNREGVIISFQIKGGSSNVILEFVFIIFGRGKSHYQIILKFYICYRFYFEFIVIFWN